MKYIILKPNCRKLANHLWNYLSIYAYSLETGAEVRNPSFIEWHRYFNLVRNESIIAKIVAPTPLLHCVLKIACKLYGSYFVRFRASCVRLTLGITMYLPPTRTLQEPTQKCLATYFIGWHFRNPIGLEKYRNALIDAFTPTTGILNMIEAILAPLKGKRLIGVHMRQEPYRGFEDGRFLVAPSRVRQIVDEFLLENKMNLKDVALVTVSDKYDATNLFLLSKCSVVIGTNSTFSNLAAWFGNVPHIVATNEPMDWEYYRNRQTYFENKYATLAQ